MSGQFSPDGDKPYPEGPVKSRFIDAGKFLLFWPSCAFFHFFIGGKYV